MNRARFTRWTLAFVVLLLSTGLATTTHAQPREGAVGIGGQIGSPSGLTLKVFHANRLSWDFLAAWDLDNFFFLNVHGLIEKRFGNEPGLHFFYGPGAFIGFRDTPPGRDDDVVIGVSGSFGIGYWYEQLEFFGQLTPRLSVIPETDGDIGGGVGLRFYFQ